MAHQMANDKSAEKVESRWRLAGRLDDLRSMVVTYTMLSFHHVRREENQVADLMANIDAIDVKASQRGAVDSQMPSIGCLRYG